MYATGYQIVFSSYKHRYTYLFLPLLPRCQKRALSLLVRLPDVALERDDGDLAPQKKMTTRYYERQKKNTRPERVYVQARKNKRAVRT